MERSRGLAMTLAAAALWGTSFPANRLGLDDTDPYTFLLVRFAIGFAALLPFAVWKGVARARLLRNPWVWGVAALNVIGYQLQFTGQQLVTPGEAALLINVGNLAVPVFAYLLLRERLEGVKAPAFALAAMGVVLIGTRGDLASVRGASFLGDVFVLASGLSWAALIVLNKRAVGDEDPVGITLAVAGLTALFAVPGALLLGSGTIHAQGLAAATYTALGCTVLAFLLFTSGLQAISSVTSGLLLLLEILVAFTFSLALGLETLTVWVAAGGVCIAGAIVLASLQDAKVPHTAPT